MTISISSFPSIPWARARSGNGIGVIRSGTGFSSVSPSLKITALVWWASTATPSPPRAPRLGTNFILKAPVLRRALAELILRMRRCLRFSFFSFFFSILAMIRRWLSIDACGLSPAPYSACSRGIMMKSR